jgi:hypothetical protein
MLDTCASHLTNPNDVFMFVFSGHGVQLDDQNGDESDRKDEAFCLRQANGDLAFLRDDDFANLILRKIPAGNRCLFITDCCHSGTITDLKRFDRHRIVSVSGCEDSQTSLDLGPTRGGLMTNLLMSALARFDAKQQTYFSMQELFDSLWKTMSAESDLSGELAARIKNQKITITWSQQADPNVFIFPLARGAKPRNFVPVRMTSEIVPTFKTSMGSESTMAYQLENLSSVPNSPFRTSAGTFQAKGSLSRSRHLPAKSPFGTNFSSPPVHTPHSKETPTHMHTYTPSYPSHPSQGSRQPPRSAFRSSSWHVPKFSPKSAAQSPVSVFPIKYIPLERKSLQNNTLCQPEHTYKRHIIS